MMYSFGWLSYRVEEDNQVFGGFTPAGLLVFECSELSIYLEVFAYYRVQTEHHFP